ncbi:cation diffusion facilitator family transporter [Enterococcus lemanii]|uniref:Cation diffusion facilitator family transporter n=1 Tax=Enterococcus lemanii TaxID=1159752 RepID=A0ABV9MY02_9ENTE|nr:cation diffusion facilitator family transporter [Enterococcus lemanii]MBM7709606.1 cation diffusion facilitator family transporter [Enterococcus lemanii]
MRQNEQRIRVKEGIRTGIFGLITNIILVIIKLIAGLIGNSVSIMADAMNSLGDTFNSILTIMGFHIANKPADREHPYGHQRAEYLSGLFTAIIISFVGLQFLISSIQKIFKPEGINRSPLVLILLILSILIKGGLAYFYYKKNKNMAVHSTAIETLMKDSLYDMFMNLVIILSYLVETQFGWLIDGYVGVFVAAIILRGGYDSIKDSSNDLLGTRPDPNLIYQMEEVLNSYDNLVGYHDLVLHKYGPNMFFATVDIEVDSRWDLLHAHQVTDAIEKEFKDKFAILLATHLDPIVLNNDEQNALYKVIKETLKSYDKNFHFHDFRVEETATVSNLHFDVVVPDSITTSDEELYQKITHDIYHKIGYKYHLYIEFDRNYVLSK